MREMIKECYKGMLCAAMEVFFKWFRDVEELRVVIVNKEGERGEGLMDGRKGSEGVVRAG